MYRRSWLAVTRDKTPIPRSTEARNFETNQARSPDPRLTSRAGSLTWNDTLLTLGQEHTTNFPKQWRNCSDTSEQHTVTSISQTSWLKPRQPYPTQRWLPSLIWALSAQKNMQRWLTLRKITLMELSSKSWGKRMYTNKICTRSTISLCAKQMTNNKRWWHQTPPSRWSILTRIQ